MSGQPDKDRSAITGRYVTDEYADENPNTTVSERAEPCKPASPAEPAMNTGPSPGDWRCNAPGAVCQNQRRCVKYDKCCFEQWEALGA